LKSPFGEELERFGKLMHCTAYITLDIRYAVVYVSVATSWRCISQVDPAILAIFGPDTTTKNIYQSMDGIYHETL